jgi:hypothetical protein
MYRTIGGVSLAVAIDEQTSYLRHPPKPDIRATSLALAFAREIRRLEKLTPEELDRDPFFRAVSAEWLKERER